MGCCATKDHQQQSTQRRYDRRDANKTDTSNVAKRNDREDYHEMDLIR